MMDGHLPIFMTAYAPEQITPEIAVRYIRRHFAELDYLEKLENYYNGRHAILNRTKDGDLSNNKLVCNNAKYIADFTSAYLLGAPVSYSAKDNSDISPLTDALETADSETQDIDLAHDLSIFGRAYEMIYMSDGSDGEKPYPKLAKLSPRNAFVVYGNNVEQPPVFGIYYYPVFDENGMKTGFAGTLSTSAYIQNFTLSTEGGLVKAAEQIPHYFGKVTIDEIYNNSERMGDFEQVMSLIDAYNTLQSDRVNDKEQFVKALLVIKGQVLGDTDEESAAAYDSIKQNGVMTLDADGDASFLTRQLDESSVEVLRKSIENDIAKYSGVPDMTDEHFAGNVSGQAMKFKLLALEQMTKIKERFFTEGLRYRLECISNVLAVQGSTKIPVKNIQMQFTHSLPANLAEDAQIVNSLSGHVSEKTLLGLLSFVKDPGRELETLHQEQQEKTDNMLHAQQSMLQTDMRMPINKMK